ncbi:MAG: GNAT family N-acetyltransferase [Anaerolineae bacterium]|nr:GNAT family N-acetyltransferase [Anaerolineae bacterium]
MATIHSLTSRCYETEEDLTRMQGLLMEARARTNDWRYAHVGDLNWWFFMVLCHLEPREHVRLWHDGAGKLVGYAILGEDPTFDWQVLPEYEWSGVEDEAMAWAETRLADLRARDAEAWGGKLVSGARQDDAQRIAFLEKCGFQRGTYAESNMLRWLDEPIAEPVVPPGWQVRAVAEVGETSNRTAAQREVWQPWSVGNVGDEDYARLMRLPGYERELDVVAVSPAGVIAAYVNGWIDPVNRIGDFGPVGALPAYRRQGLTQAVLLECLWRMKARGMERVSVSTGVSHTPALRLYASVGFRIVNEYHEYVRPGVAELV